MKRCISTSNFSWDCNCFEACKASNIRDKEEILRYIRKQHGGIYALNGSLVCKRKRGVDHPEGSSVGFKEGF